MAREAAVSPGGEARGPRMRGHSEPAAEPVTGRLVVIVEDGTEGRAIDLRGRQVDLGSRDGDILLSEDRYLSPRHARFFRQDDAWYVRDLDSVNGVYRRLWQPTPLRDGDRVLLGLEVLRFEHVDQAERGLGHAVEHGILVFGSPATTRRARLLQRTVEGVTRDVYHLVADETTIGRETGDIVFTSDPFMSRRHAAIAWDEASQAFVLNDLNSSNGTYLAIREDTKLDHGDFIRVGQHLFRVDIPRRDASVALSDGGSSAIPDGRRPALRDGGRR
ncbi:MAG: FHA domain-containing protein [Myxococcota bacterium]